MGEAPSSPSPPPSPPLQTPTMPMLYYGLAIVGTAATIVAIYNLIIIRWCTRLHHRRRAARQGPDRAPSFGAGSSLEYPRGRLVSSFNYQRERKVAQEGQGFDSECPICLSLFEEGEEVRKLPRCKHSFHASCIDMWLYSHYDCPVCRATVEPPIPRWLTAADSQVIAQVEPLGRGIPL